MSSLLYFILKIRMRVRGSWAQAPSGFQGRNQPSGFREKIAAKLRHGDGTLRSWKILLI